MRLRVRVHVCFESKNNANATSRLKVCMSIFGDYSVDLL